MTAAATPMPVIGCPLCSHPALHETADRVHLKVNCAACGAFEITDTARVALETLPRIMLVSLSRAVQAEARHERRLLITLQNFARLMAPYL